MKGHNRQAFRRQQILEGSRLAAEVSQDFLGQVRQALFPGVFKGRLGPGPEEFHDPGAQLTRGLAGKGQGQEFFRRLHPGQQGKEAGQQHRSLAGARRGFQVKAPPGAQGPIPGVLIGGQGGHAAFLVIKHNEHVL